MKERGGGGDSEKHKQIIRLKDELNKKENGVMYNSKETKWKRKKERNNNNKNKQKYWKKKRHPEKTRKRIKNKSKGLTRNQ